MLVRGVPDQQANLNHKEETMLEHYFCCPRTLYQMRLGPLGEFIDELAGEIKDEGYSKWTARHLLKGAAHFSRYMLWKGIENIEEINMDQINDFLTNHLPVCNCERPNHYDFRGERAAMKKIVQFLKKKGIMKEEKKAYSPESPDGLLIRYEEYLRRIRALGDRAIKNHLILARRILSLRRQQNNGVLELEKLTAGEALDITTMLLDVRDSHNWKSAITSTMRTFLRFLTWDRVLPRDLGHIIPSHMHWRLAEIPHALTEKQLQRLLDTPDRTTLVGKRDYAVLVILATTGIRASELIALTTSSVHWRRRTLTVFSCKTQKEREMPLSDLALFALEDYCRNARPKTSCKTLFIKTKAPYTGFANSSGVTTIVTQNVIRSGIQRTCRRGSHMLRHTLATFLVNRGVSYKEAADILGHSCIETTRIYAKTDMKNLRKVVTPFPKCNWEK